MRDILNITDNFSDKEEVLIFCSDNDFIKIESKLKESINQPFASFKNTFKPKVDSISFFKEGKTIIFAKKSQLKEFIKLL